MSTEQQVALTDDERQPCEVWTRPGIMVAVQTSTNGHDSLQDDYPQRQANYDAPQGVDFGEWADT